MFFSGFFLYIDFSLFDYCCSIQKPESKWMKLVFCNSTETNWTKNFNCFKSETSCFYYYKKNNKNKKIFICNFFCFPEFNVKNFDFFLRITLKINNFFFVCHFKFFQSKTYFFFFSTFYKFYYLFVIIVLIILVN